MGVAITAYERSLLLMTVLLLLSCCTTIDADESFFSVFDASPFSVQSNGSGNMCLEQDGLNVFPAPCNFLDKQNFLYGVQDESFKVSNVNSARRCLALRLNTGLSVKRDCQSRNIPMIGFVSDGTIQSIVPGERRVLLNNLNVQSGNNDEASQTWTILINGTPLFDTLKISQFSLRNQLNNLCLELIEEQDNNGQMFSFCLKDCDESMDSQKFTHKQSRIANVQFPDRCMVFRDNGMISANKCNDNKRKQELGFVSDGSIQSLSRNRPRILQVTGDLDISNTNRNPRLNGSQMWIIHVDSTINETQLPTIAPTEIAPPSPTIAKLFDIQLMNMGTNTDFDAVFQSAKERWEEIIVGDLRSLSANVVDDWFDGTFGPENGFNGAVDDLVIGYAIEFIDGVGQILGQAGPTFVRSDTSSSIAGTMQFDEDDFALFSVEDAGIIILHEMGHVLGLIGIINPECGCNFEAPDPFAYQCSFAQEEYAQILPGQTLRLENDGGGGTVCSHWEEDSFPQNTGSSELMTGFFEAGSAQPLSRVTVGALNDQSSEYVVNYDMADPYPFVPSPTDTQRKVLWGTTNFTVRGKMLVPKVTYMHVVN